MSPRPLLSFDRLELDFRSKLSVAAAERLGAIGVGAALAVAVACFLYMVAHTQPEDGPHAAAALPPLVEEEIASGSGAAGERPLTVGPDLWPQVAAPQPNSAIVPRWAGRPEEPPPPNRHPEVEAVAPLPPPRPPDLAGTPKLPSGPASREAFIAAAGYDRWTAVYDIVAHTVYLPDGSRLEAHSGLGDRLDDPRYVGERDRGATPPHLYDLEPREGLFHGVRALRLTPVAEGDIFGRAGLLAHPYMLGPRGDSNGCVSFKDYDAFLRAYDSGQVKRIAVVARMPEAEIASAK